MKKKIYLHIGAHKTASSMLQAALEFNADEITKSKIIPRRRMLNMAFYDELKRVINTSKGLNPTVQAINELSNEIEGYNHVLLTNEDLFCRLHIKSFYQNIRLGLQYIKKLLPDYEINVVLYIREQSSYIESIYTQYIHLGEVEDFESFLNSLPGSSRDFPLHLNWLTVLNDIEKEIGESNICVNYYEEIKRIDSSDYYNKFLQSIALPERESLSFNKNKFKGRAENRSFSKVAIDIFKYASPMITKKEQNILRSFLQNNFSTKTHPKDTFLTDEIKNNIREYYLKSNKEVFKKYMALDLPSEYKPSKKTIASFDKGSIN